MKMLTRRELFTKLYKELGIIITDETLDNYIRGFKTKTAGEYRFFSWYPDVLPHEKGVGGRNLYDYMKVISWLKKYRSRMYFSKEEPYGHTS